MASIVVGVDTTDFSLEALRCASDLVDEIDSGELIVAFARFVYLALPDHVGEAIHADALEHDEQYVRDRVARDLEGRATTWQFVSRVGEPAKVLLELARETDARCIVFGRYTRSRVLELLFGSVSRRVLRSAKCPVLVVDRPKARRPSVRDLGRLDSHGRHTSTA